MQDRPTSPELIETVAQFLNEELAPALVGDPRLRFRVLIAGNILNILAREITEGEPLLRAEWARLTGLLEGKPEAQTPLHPTELYQATETLTYELCRRIRAGEADSGAGRELIVNHLERTTIEKLQIANPRFLERDSYLSKQEGSL